MCTEPEQTTFLVLFPKQDSIMATYIVLSIIRDLEMI